LWTACRWRCSAAAGSLPCRRPTALQAAKARAAAAAAAEQAQQAQQAARAAARLAAAQQLERPGPHLTLSGDRVAMSAVAGGDVASGVLTATNTGSTALFFQWRPVGSSLDAPAPAGEPPGSEGGRGDDDGAGDAGGGAPVEEDEQGREPSAAAAAHEAGAEGGGGDGDSDARPRFYLADSSGVLLPGETRDFVFSFRCSAAGIFGEAWALATTPPLPAAPPRRRAGAPLLVELRGIAVPPELGRVEVARMALEEELRRQERDQQVRGQQ
jgi:hypothetical protein